MSPDVATAVCENVLAGSRGTRTASRLEKRHFGEAKSNQSRQKPQQILQQLQIFRAERTNQWQLARLSKVQGISIQLRLMRQNLLFNAIKYICKRTKVKIPISSTKFRQED